MFSVSHLTFVREPDHITTRCSMCLPRLCLRWQLCGHPCSDNLLVSIPVNQTKCTSACMLILTKINCSLNLRLKGFRRMLVNDHCHSWLWLPLGTLNCRTSDLCTIAASTIKYGQNFTGAPARKRYFRALCFRSRMARSAFPFC